MIKDDLHCKILIFIFSASVYLLLGRGMVSSGDAIMMLKVTQSIVEKGTVDIIPEDNMEEIGSNYIQGQNGKFYSIYGMGKSIINIPSYKFGKFVSLFFSNYDQEYFIHFFVSQINPILSSCVLIYLFTLCRLFFFNISACLVLSLIYGFCTIAFPYAKDDMSEPLASFFVLGGVISIIKLSRSGSAYDSLLASLFYSGAVATRYVLAFIPVVSGIFILLLILRKGIPKRFSVLLYFGVLGLFAFLLLLFNFYRFGSFLETGYDKAGGGIGAFHFISLKFCLNFIANLFSPGRGIFVYMPVFLFFPFGMRVLFSKDRFGCIFILIILFINFIIVSGYRFFEGGWSWGPRLLLPTLPLLIPFVGASFVKIASRRSFFVLALGVCFVSFLINFGATFVNWHRYLTYLGALGMQLSDTDIIWSLKDSQIANQPWNFWEVVSMSEDSRRSLTSGQKNAKDAFLNNRSLNLINIWSIRLYYEGISLKILIIPVSILVSLSIISGWLLWKVVFSKENPDKNIRVFEFNA